MDQRSNSSLRSIADDRTPLPPPPTPPKIHNNWEASYTHSAQCDGCHTKKHPVLQRCLSCALQYCRKCMVKARLNGHEYVEEELDWDVRNRPKTFRDHGSWKRMEDGGEMGVRRSNLKGLVGGEEEIEDGDFMVEETSKRREKPVRTARASAATPESLSFHSPSKDTLMTGEQDKYGRQGHTNHFIEPRNTPESRRYASEATLLDDADDDGDTESDDDFEILLPEPRRSDHSPGIASRADVGRSSSFAISGRPSNRQEPVTHQQQQQSQTQPSLSRSTASTASFHHNQTQSQNYRQQPSQTNGYYQSPYQSPYESPYSSTAPANPSQPIIPSNVHQTSTIPTPTSSFSDATEAVLFAQTQEDIDTLPRRREEFDEYCREAWKDEPVLQKLRDDGKDEEAREDFEAAKLLLYFSRGLGGMD